MIRSARAALSLLALPVVAAAAEKGIGLPKNSPFMPATAATAPGAAANENIEFAGVSSVGKKTDLIFYDKTAKKTHWVAVGDAKDGIAVVSYDEQRDQAVVRVHGVEKVISLRKGARPAAAPRPVATLPAASGFSIPTTPPAGVFPGNFSMPLPVAAAPVAPIQPAPPATPEAQAQVKAETEARMLVSDLLEIGMAQRKAYEEAQKKAGEAAPQNPPATEAPKP